MATAQDQDFHAPETVSTAGREAIAACSRSSRDMPFPAPDDIEGWKQAQAGVEATFAQVSKAVLQQYEPQIESRTLGGVSVLDIKPKD